MTTKIHAIVDALGNPLAVSLTGGHVHDVTQAQVLTQEIEPAALLADKGYDSDGFIEHLEVRSIKPGHCQAGQGRQSQYQFTHRYQLHFAGFIRVSPPRCSDERGAPDSASI